MVDYSSVPDYGTGRLRGSVCLVGGEPRWIHSITRDTVRYTPLGRLREMDFHESPLTELDTKPIRLGFINTLRGVKFLARRPARQWKQGCRPENIANTFAAGIRGRVGWPDLDHLAECHKNTYPSILACMERIDCQEVDRQAFSRHYALGEKVLGGFNLYRQSKLVGTLDINANGRATPQLEERWSFLEEELTGCINEQSR